MRSPKNIILHPFLFSIFPIISLASYNVGHIYIMESLRSLILGFLIGLIVYSFFTWVLKNKRKAALSTTLFLFIFYIYGHIYNLLKTLKLGDSFLGRHRFLLPISAIILFIGLLIIIRPKKISRKLNETLNIISVILLIFPLGSLIIDGPLMKKVTNINSDSIIEYNADLPDIYFIIFDAYGRDDTLKELFDFDNSQFIMDLQELGFYVPECTQSNYNNTQPSLSSALNMDYEENIWEGENWRSREFYQTIYDNKVRSFLEFLGYQTIAFESGFVFSEWVDADYYLSAPVQQNHLIRKSLNRFEIELLDTTLLKPIFDIETVSNFFQIDSGIMKYRQAEVQNVFELLPTIPELEGPNIIFAHILIPHEPFVYGPDGEDMVAELGGAVLNLDYGVGYTNQVQYINQKALEIIESILDKSGSEPIIIISGDHGPQIGSPQYRSTNFSAFYFPGEGSDALYSTISPVNYFRVIQNQYFGMNNKILPDISYQSDFKTRPDEYQVVLDYGRCE